ncbi:acyl carrier protein [uncultured Nostoc sp.]|uniref:acyl carrier protein n=1 Tax=uncultured Nostoc sp. TaxID=340711 RepID=UPI0035CA2870
MTDDDRTYKLDILKKVIKTYLDETVAVTEEGLNSLVSKHDETVWKIATKIYSESGHKVEFSLMREIVNSHIEVLKMHVATEKAAAYKRLQYEKVEEARRVAQEAQQATETENRRQNRLTELAKKLDESGRDKSMSDLFVKVLDIVSEQLSVDELDKVSLTNHICNDLGADELDTVELAMALEEAFDFNIEIPEDILGSVKKWPPSYSNDYFGDSVPVACTVGELLDYIHKQILLKD